MDHAIQVKLLGVRGTAPVHGADFTQFGGATSCVLVAAAGQALILDSGTGLLSQNVADFFHSKKWTMLISHSHVDHILALPAFGPVFDPDVQLDIYLKSRAGLDCKGQLEALVAPPLWPVRTDAMKAQVRFHDLPTRFSLGAVEVDAMESNHPGGSTLYRITCGGRRVVYATDYEPEDDCPPDFGIFARNCDLLLLDAQYTGTEYKGTRGFGHSTIERSVAIARGCGARQTLLVHHDPKRTDAQLLELERWVQAQDPSIRFGRAGEEVFL